VGKRKRADLGPAIDILQTIYDAELPRDHPDHKYQVKVEFPAVDRALGILRKQWMKDAAKQDKLRKPRSPAMIPKLAQSDGA
jgi:hypothetical protein